MSELALKIIGKFHKTLSKIIWLIMKAGKMVIHYKGFLNNKRIYEKHSLGIS